MSSGNHPVLLVKHKNKRDRLYKCNVEQSMSEYYNELGVLPKRPKLTKRQLEQNRKNYLKWEYEKDIGKINQFKYSKFSSNNLTIYGIEQSKLSKTQIVKIMGNLNRVESALRSISEISKKEDLLLVGEPLNLAKPFVETATVEEIKEALRQRK